MTESHADQPLPQVVDSYPVDVSPFGLRGMGGNIRDWCADRFEKAGPKILHSRVPAPEFGDSTDDGFRAVRGGAWFVRSRLARCAYRTRAQPWFRLSYFGFRLARPVGEAVT